MSQVVRNRTCLGDYDFNQIAQYARKRFIEGIDTITLLQQATSESEKEQIALVCLLSVDDDQIRDINLHCRYADRCKLSNCRDLLRNLLQQELVKTNSTHTLILPPSLPKEYSANSLA